jgi:hypothetical protein
MADRRHTSSAITGTIMDDHTWTVTAVERRRPRGGHGSHGAHDHQGPRPRRGRWRSRPRVGTIPRSSGDWQPSICMRRSLPFPSMRPPGLTCTRCGRVPDKDTGRYTLPTVKKSCQQGTFFAKRGRRQAIIIDCVARLSTNCSPCGCTGSRRRSDRDVRFGRRRDDDGVHVRFLNGMTATKSPVDWPVTVERLQWSGADRSGTLPTRYPDASSCG